MKKGLLHIILVVFIFTSTSIGQLSKLPVLVAHFNEHKQQSKDLSFVEFLRMHYATTNDGDNDSAKDNELPFKKITPITNYTIVAPHTVAFELKPIYPTETKKTMFRYLDFVPDNTTHILIQPPKIS
jgi:hypothetical protein